MSGPYCERHARAREHGRCDMCQLEAQCAEMREALECFITGYPDGEWAGMLHEEGCVGVQLAPGERDEDDPCKCDGDYNVTLVKQALAADAGKALLERLEHHRKTATEYLTALEEFKERLEKAERKRDEAVSAVFKLTREQEAKGAYQLGYLRAFEECAKALEARANRAFLPTEPMDEIRRELLSAAATIRAKAKEGT